MRASATPFLRCRAIFNSFKEKGAASSPLILNFSWPLDLLYVFRHYENLIHFIDDNEFPIIVGFESSLKDDEGSDACFHKRTLGSQHAADRQFVGLEMPSWTRDYTVDFDIPHLWTDDIAETTRKKNAR